MKDYTLIDAVWIYQNEQEVGEGIRAAIAANFAKREANGRAAVAHK